MDEKSFFDSRFSTHFNRAAYLGKWSLATLADTKSKVVFVMYRLIGFLLLIVGLVEQMIDLVLVFGNLRKVTYNLCTSVIVIGIIIKIILLYGRRKELKHLRKCLWEDSLKMNSEEDMAIQNSAYTHLLYLRYCFYTAAVIFLPIWLIFSYFSYKWGPRQLAFAGYNPIDMLDDRVYVPILLYQGLSAAFTIFLVIETDLSMFSMVLQIEAFYHSLIKDIFKLNEIYGDEGDDCNNFNRCKGEVNPYLKTQKAKKWLKLLIIRHMEIINYCTQFEHIFSFTMLMQVIAASLLIVMNGLELSMYLHEMSVKIYFQSGYVVLIAVDLFFICYFMSRLSTESLNVGIAAYSTVWYKMDASERKSLQLLMIRTQRPPKITGGNFFVLCLPVYLHMLRNIYSWLMLFRQFDKK